MVGGKPLDEKKKYTLATSDYVGIDGGDGYSMLKGARLLIPREQAPIDSDVLQAAIAAKKVIAPKSMGASNVWTKIKNRRPIAIEVAAV